MTLYSNIPDLSAPTKRIIFCIDTTINVYEIITTLERKPCILPSYYASKGNVLWLMTRPEALVLFLLRFSYTNASLLRVFRVQSHALHHSGALRQYGYIQGPGLIVMLSLRTHCSLK
jgi:hypothetical protein